MENSTEQQQPEKRKRGRPRIHPPKPPKPKLTKEELSAVRAAAGRKGARATLANGTHYKGGRPKGMSGEGYHRSDNIAAGEERVQMSVLKSSADTFRRFAAHEDCTIIAAVKIVTDNLRRNHPEIFAPDAPPAAGGVTV